MSAEPLDAGVGEESTPTGPGTLDVPDGVSLTPYGRLFGRSKARLLVSALMLVVPASVRRFLATKVLGWDIHPTALIGRSFIDVKKVVMGEGAVIRGLNYISGLEELRMGDQSSIGLFNWISGPPLSSGAFAHCPRRYPALIMGRRSAVVWRHRLDCTDTITIGDYSVVAGIQTLILTHSVDLFRYRMEARPTTIGAFCLVSARCTMLIGARLPDYAILSSGSVVNTRLKKSYSLYNGVPAVHARDLPQDMPIWSPDRARYAD